MNRQVKKVLYGCHETSAATGLVRVILVLMFGIVVASRKIFSSKQIYSSHSKCRDCRRDECICGVVLELLH